MPLNRITFQDSFPWVWHFLRFFCISNGICALGSRLGYPEKLGFSFASEVKVGCGMPCKLSCGSMGKGKASNHAGYLRRLTQPSLGSNYLQNATMHVHHVSLDANCRLAITQNDSNLFCFQCPLKHIHVIKLKKKIEHSYSIFIIFIIHGHSFKHILCCYAVYHRRYFLSPDAAGLRFVWLMCCMMFIVKLGRKRLKEFNLTKNFTFIFI